MRLGKDRCMTTLMRAFITPMKWVIENQAKGRMDMFQKENNLSPSKTLFIDDSIQNINAAKVFRVTNYF